MENIYFVACIISVCYLILSILEMRFIQKEVTPLKELVKNVFIVFVSSMFGFYVVQQMIDKPTPPTEVFIGKPEF